MEYDVVYFNDFIKNSNSFYAHLPKSGDSKSPEYLAEHSSLTVKYARLIVERNRLTPIISKLIDSSIPSKFSNRQLLANCIEKYFWRAIAFHDLGKVNRNFQINKMKNHNVNLPNIEHNFGDQHSIISMYIYLADFWSEFLSLELTEGEQFFLLDVILYLSYSISKHHSYSLDNAMDNERWTNTDLFKLSPFLAIFGVKLNDAQIDEFYNCYLSKANFDILFCTDILRHIMEQTNSFPLFALIKLNFSLLTASDYLATSHYMNNWNELIADFGLIDNSLHNKIVKNAFFSKDYNKLVSESLNNKEKINLSELQEKSNINLNKLRQCLAVEAITNIRNSSSKNLFYIEAPTGGGKTNMSMLAMAELLKNDEHHLISKVFYVFPFTTLITQTYASLKDTFGLEDSEIAEIHSKAAFSTGHYEEDYKNYIDYLFLNFPIILLSHIKFFDILKTNKKESNYLLNRLSNSIVIIDELQSYSPQIWDKIIYFIANYAEYFNMKFILMSATLPKIGDILNNKNIASNFVYLVNNKSKYFQNPNFCDRIKFDYSLLALSKPNKDNKTEYLHTLWEKVSIESKEYSSNNVLYPESVFTIIEFIFKKTASEFYNLALQENKFFDEILLLSGTILEPRRKEIIGNLKSKEFRKKKILLISTQVVEAGVDIDMDLGFKDKSLIDSEEQLAGRVNRNAIKDNCKVFIFDCDEEKIIYRGDARFKVMGELKDEYKNILVSKDFDALYGLIISRIRQKNDCPLIENLSEVTDNVSALDFKEVDNKLNIIQTENVSVFVPLLIHIDNLKGYLKILKEFEIQCKDGFVDGKDIWNLYEQTVVDGKEDFVQNRVKLKKIQGLMSNFCFSMYPKSKDYSRLMTFGIMKLGYLYLESYHDVYSFNDGINTDLLENSNFL